MVKIKKVRKKRRYKMGVIILFLVPVMAGMLMLSLPQFYIKKMVIESDVDRCHDAISEQIKSTMGDHMLKHVGGKVNQLLALRYGELEQRVADRCPEIKDIQIHGKFPSTLIVDVTYRQEIACVQVADGYATIDADNVVVRLFRDRDAFPGPVIEGLSVERAVIGQTINFSDDKAYDTCLVVLGSILLADMTNDDASGFNLMRHLVGLYSIASDEIMLLVSEPSSDQTIVILPGATQHIEADMNWLRCALAQGAFKEMERGVLDMRGDDYVFSATKA